MVESGLMPSKPLEVKRVLIGPMVSPLTKDAVKRLAAMLGLSQGEVIDDAIAGMVGAFADSPLREDEEIGRTEPIDLVMLDRATTRAPKAKRESLPEALLPVYTKRVSRESMLAVFPNNPVADDLDEMPILDAPEGSIGRGKATVQSWRRGPRPKGSKR
jgi:hypothetical protein